MNDKTTTKAPDDNDRLRAGKLPDDPTDDTRVVSRGPRILTVRDLLVASQKRATSPRRAGVITTGNYRIDALTGGIQPGHGWIFAAETNYGKTSWTVALADENLKLGKRVLMVPTEDTEQIYGDRLLSRRSGVSATRIRDQKLDAVDIQKISDTVQRAEPLPVYLDGLDIPEDKLCEQIKAAVLEYDMDLVIVDYLQTIPKSHQYQDERVRFRETASRITHTCKALKVPVVICSQITPDDTGKIPGKYRVRESKDIVNAAEAVLIGFELQADWTDKRDPSRVIPAGTKCVNVDKAKCGTKGIVAMRWNEVTANFEAEYPPAQGDDYLDQYADRYDHSNTWSRAASALDDDLAGPPPHWTDR